MCSVGMSTGVRRLSDIIGVTEMGGPLRLGALGLAMLAPTMFDSRYDDPDLGSTLY